MRVTMTDVHIQAAINMRRASVVDVVRVAREAASQAARPEKLPDSLGPARRDIPTGAV